MNRWQAVNGFWQVHTGPVGGLRSGEVRYSDWGAADGSVGAVVYNGQFQVWSSPGVLSVDRKAAYDATLASNEESSNCLSLLQSIGTAAGFWAARNDHNLYSDEATGLIFTGFQSSIPGRAAQKSWYEDWIGSYGSANVFSGVEANQVWRSGIPKPPRPERPPGRGQGGGR